MSIYTHSNVAVTGGSSTYVAGNLHNHMEVHELRERSVAFEKLCQHTAASGLHNSGEVADQPKCHPGTRIAILDYLFAWAATLIYTHPIIWLHGPAGAGKSAILRTIAQQLFEERLLLASFFFFRTSGRRNTSEHVIATIAYQLALSIPETRQQIEKAIERNPIIFSLSLWDQALALIVSPIVSTFYNPSFHTHKYPRVIVIDGLDECHDPNKQCEILQVFRRIIRSVPIPLAILVASRPEHHIRGEFDLGDLNKCSSRLTLDRNYDPDSDIEKYLVDRFNSIRRHHPMKSLLQPTWPGQQVIDKLVAKASGQFIYVATVDKFVSSPRHNPAKRLNIIIGTLSAEGLRPFEQLDNLYSTIFGTVIEEDLVLTLRVLGVLLVPHSGNDLNRGNSDFDGDPVEDKIVDFNDTRSPRFVERLLELDRGDVQRLLFDLESLLTIGQSGENVRFFHASLSDYLFDRSRSAQFWIDAELVYADLAEHCVRHSHHWPEIRHFLMTNYLLFFSKATPTAELRQAIQKCDFARRVVIASSGHGPHWLRDLCPTLLQVVVEKSRFPDVKNLFADQLGNFKRIIAARVHEVYFSSTSLRSMLVARTLVSPMKHGPVFCYRLTQEEIWTEYTRGFDLYTKTGDPPIIPLIRTLLNDVNSGCFINGDQYADIAAYILEPFVGSDDPTLFLDVLTEKLIPLLLSKSSTRADLIRNVEKFTLPRGHDRVSLSVPLRGAIEAYLSRQQSPEEQQIPMRQHDSRAPKNQEIVARMAPPLCRKRLQQGSDNLDFTETSPLLDSSSRAFKRARTTTLRVTGACPPPLLSCSSSVTECEVRKIKWE